MTTEAAALEQLETLKMVVELFCIPKQLAEDNTRKAVRDALDRLHRTLVSGAPWTHVEMSSVDRAIKELLTQYQDPQPETTE